MNLQPLSLVIWLKDTLLQKYEVRMQNRLVTGPTNLLTVVIYDYLHIQVLRSWSSVSSLPVQYEYL